MSAPMIAACGFAVIGVATLPNLAPVSTPKLVLVVLAAAATTVTGILSWPLRRRVVIDHVARRVHSGKLSFPLDECLGLKLTGRAAYDDDFPDPRYRCELLFRRGTVVLGESADPAKLLPDIGALAARLELKVHQGWGLPRSATPWVFQNTGEPMQPHATTAPLSLTSRPIPNRRSTTLAIAVASIAVLLDLGALALGEIQRPGVVILNAGLSLGLVGAVAALLALISALLWTRNRRLLFGDIVTLEERAFGMRLHARSVPLTAVRGVHVLEAEDSQIFHVLVDTDRGPLAFPCDGGRARPFKEAADKLLDGRNHPASA